MNTLLFSHSLVLVQLSLSLLAGSFYVIRSCYRSAVFSFSLLTYHKAEIILLVIIRIICMKFVCVCAIFFLRFVRISELVRREKRKLTLNHDFRMLCACMSMKYVYCICFKIACIHRTKQIQQMKEKNHLGT